jgi:branched-chain amino acid transport system permease protein
MSSGMSKQFASKDDHLSRVSIIGGLASIRGAFGAALLVVFPLILSRVGSLLFGERFDSGVLDMSQHIVLGGLIIIFLIAEPDGLVALWDRLKRRLLPLPNKL